MAAIGTKQILVVADADEVLRSSNNVHRLRHFVSAGGKLLLLNAGTELTAMFPEQITGYRKCDGEIVGMKIPESVVFDGIEPLDLSWFACEGRGIPRACTGTYNVNKEREDVVVLAEAIDIHGYLKTPQDVIQISGSPLLELRLGRGLVIASEMVLEAAAADPVAGRLFRNLIRRLSMSDQTVIRQISALHEMDGHEFQGKTS